MDKFKKGLAIAGVIATAIMPALAFAQPAVPPDTGPIATSADSVYNILNKIISIAFYILMFLAILFILYAAFKYLTAGGDPEAVQTAQRMLLYAVVAIVIAVLARSIPWIITNFVRSNLTGA